MTELGEFFNKKSVNKAEVSRRTGINASRLSELSLNKKARLTAEEVVLIAKAMDIEPSLLLMEVCKNVELVSEK
jgi:plasmid maintenance system antidote protein VapI